MLRFSGPGPLVLCLAAAALAGVGAAQTKVGVVSLQRAVLQSDEIQKASKDLEAKYRPRQQRMEGLQKELQDIQQRLQSGAGKLSPQNESDLTSEGQRKQRELQRLNEDLQADVERERNEILGRSSQRMQEVVRKLAEDKGLDLVIDVGQVIYVKPSIDLTADAIAAYNKVNPGTPAPAPAPPTATK